MKKQSKSLLIMLVVAVVLGLAVALLLLIPKAKPATEELPALSRRAITEVKQVEVENTHGAYALRQVGTGSYTLGDLPAEAINLEYLQMLLEESAVVEYLETVEENPKQLSIYGLDEPASRVTITYTDGESLRLLIGAEETLSGGQYVMRQGGAVLLMKHNRTIRFTMPIEKYINFIIVPFCELPSPLSAIKDITFAGSAFPEPIEIRAVTKENQAVLRTAESFGAATHITVSPGIHEINQSECVDLFQSVVGLLSEEVVAYNCTEEELAAYGFDDPFLDITYDWANGRDAPLERVRLRVSRYDGGYLLTRDDSGIVHRINSGEAMLHTSYDKIVMRWFFTPFITDISGLTLTLDGERHSFEFAGEKNAELSVTADGKALNMELFRRFYTLLVSASHDGSYQPNAVPTGEKRMELVFRYRDPEKPDDTLALYSADLRRMLVEMNGKSEFTMLEKYYTAVKAALPLLLAEESFETIW